MARWREMMMMKDNEVDEMYRTMKGIKIKYYYSASYGCYILEVHLWKLHIRFLHWWK